MQPLLLLLALLVAAVARAQIDGFDTGQWNTETIDLGTLANPLAQFAPYHLRVHYPTTCPGQCGPFQSLGMPVLMFVTGFAGSLPASHYDTVMQRAAKHGIVVVVVDQDLTGFALTLDISRFGVNLQKVIAYIKSGELLAKIRAPGTGKVAFKATAGLFQDGGKIFYGGHSSGAHIALQNIVDIVDANGVCPSDVAGVVMLSPLDGQDPLGFGGNFAIQPKHGARLLFTTPGLIVSGELDRASGKVFQGMPCVPDDRGNAHFLHGWPGFCQLTEAKGMGTLDVLDEAVTTAYDQYCAVSNKTTDQNARLQYRTMVRGSIVTFIQGVVTNQASYISKLKSTGDLNYPTTKIEVHEGATGAGCAYFPMEPKMTVEQELGLIFFAVTFAMSFIFGLCYIFQKMDAETTHRYYTQGELQYDGAASYQTKLEPQYVQSGGPSMNFNDSQQYAPSVQASQNYSRQVSINV